MALIYAMDSRSSGFLWSNCTHKNTELIESILVKQKYAASTYDVWCESTAVV